MRVSDDATVFAWCKTGTTIPIPVGRHTFFGRAQDAVTSWNSCKNISRGQLKLADFVLMEFYTTPKNSHPAIGCKKCGIQIPNKDEMKNNDGHCWRCKRRW